MQDPTLSTPAAEIRRAGVDLNGLMTVLGKHLYSTPMVALRELVQNGHDSIIRRRLEQPGIELPSRISVQVDAAAGVLRITDTGAGLTRQEIHDYLATVGVGYTRGLRQGGDDQDGLIGMFGLGFLSAFVLARRVSVRTTSYQTPELGQLYVSSNAEQYTVSEVPARAVGTEVELELHADFLPLANEARLYEVLGRYCALLSEPIFIGAAAEALNPEPPPWRGQGEVALHPVQARRQALQFAARFEHDFEPIVTVPLRADADSDATGMLWVQDGATYGTSDNRNLSVFVRGMLLDDDARHNEALLGAALCDERLFELLLEHVRVPTSQGDLPASALPARGAVHVILDNGGGFEEMLFRAMGVPVAHGHRYAVVPFLRRWTQAKGLRLVELGTEQGNRALFRTDDSLDDAQLAWLGEHLGDGEQLLPARFSPEALPVVVVPDREAELKQRLEDDENDKRVSMAALRLARQFTARIEVRAPSRLYINLDNPAVQALLQAQRDGHPQAPAAARLLRSLKVIVSAQGRPLARGAATPGPDLNGAFSDIAGALQQMLR